MNNIIKIFCIILVLSVSAYSQDDFGENWRKSEYVNIKNVNGKFYAYIVLLFNENPHFVNIIEKDSIPLKMIGNQIFNINAYKTYLSLLQSTKMKSLGQSLLNAYFEPEKYSDAQLREFERQLEIYNIVLKFSRDKSTGTNKLVLNYCIYGSRSEIHIKHPLLPQKEKIYNIQPFIYYDEFSTSNSTFYFDMIYINMEEVMNDAQIAKKIISNENVKTMFFVGSRITDDIKYCLSKYFSENSEEIKDEIWNIFVVHELTHKLINNQYDFCDQISGEELSLMSTLYVKPYLGLSVMYAYLNYNFINPHRIAVMQFLKFVSAKTGNKEILSNPSLLKLFPESELKELSKEYFNLTLASLK